MSTLEAPHESTKPSKWGKVRSSVKFTAAAKEKNRATKADSLSVSNAPMQSSAGAAAARSLVLFFGFLFRRPSKLFKPNRGKQTVDTWLGLRQLAISTDQHLSPAFIRSLLQNRTGLIAVGLTILPPMLVNATLGFLLFTSHSLFSLGLAKLDWFQRKVEVENEKGEMIVEEQEEELNLETLIRGPSVIPNHPTVLSAVAGAGAGLIQGMAFTPVDNVVRLIHQSTTSWVNILARFVHLPVPKTPDNMKGSSVTPVQAIKNFFSDDAWRRNRNWWIGWRWAVSRDALSYSCFFATFDVTRRVGLRVKGMFGGNIEHDWDNIFILDFDGNAHDDSISSPSPPPSNNTSSSLPTYRPTGDQPQAPTLARVAQAATIVTGGVLASLLAQAAGRPFRECQRIMQLDDREWARRAAKGEMMARRPHFWQALLKPRPGARPHPILNTLQTKGLRPFIRSEGEFKSAQMKRELAQEAQAQGKLRGMVGTVVKRVGWRVASVGPWGCGFLVWAWIGGEV
ncbi:hypothetical protein L198_01711 [Cryptococcus wingfieldii CBS 7118]|uniref:Mitochondrial carrier protein n=1 Tax=Cryptococcus wingfieldii CBS 7118 TaxID=1295528 RepID=A0A1E3K088_9TREE|nr:hypothetical protein L198_01711 [Cryptococcus wingfieldii CBS 7118]ODO06479.1 hypothetical protein L198_01711 [Cryptococcus wingfieldii CBS 7118]